MDRWEPFLNVTKAHPPQAAVLFDSSTDRDAFVAIIDRICKAMSVRRVRKITFCLSYFVIVGLLIFTILEGAASVILRKRVEKSLSIFSGILQSEHNVLEIKPYCDVMWQEPEFSVSVRTNSRGYREEFEFEDGRVDVAFMGDSFTFGHGVNVLNRYSNVAARQHRNLTIVSLSYNNGFQPEHYEYFLDRHPELRPKVLFVGLYLGNDLEGDVIETLIERDKYGKIAKLELPYKDVYQGVLINRGNYKYEWLSKLVEVTSLGKVVAARINSSHELRRIFVKEQKLTNEGNRLSTEFGNLDQINLRAIRSLMNIAQMIQMRGGELDVLLIPQNFLVGYVQNPHVAPENAYRLDEIRSRYALMKSVLNLCKNNGLKCHDLSRILTTDDYFEGDAHWNEKGHEKAGRYASEVIAKTVVESN